MGCQKLAVYDYFASVEAQPKSADWRNDGNMTATTLSSGDWTYTWNAENRLSSVSSSPSSSSSPAPIGVKL